MTLFTAATEMLSELKTLTAETRQQNEEVKAGLISLINLLNGFTSGGANFHATQVDPFLMTYIAIAAPAISRRIEANVPEYQELLVQSLAASRVLLEEIDAYRSSGQEGRELLANQLEFTDDPWKDKEEKPDQKTG